MQHTFKRAVPIILQPTDEQATELLQFIKVSQRGLNFYIRQHMIQMRDNAEWRMKDVVNKAGNTVTLYHRQPSNWYALCDASSHFVRVKHAGNGAYLAAHEQTWQRQGAQRVLGAIRRHRDAWSPLKASDARDARFDYVGPKYRTSPHVKENSSVPVRAQTSKIEYDTSSKNGGTWKLSIYSPQHRREHNLSYLEVKWYVPSNIQKWCRFLPEDVDFGGNLSYNTGKFTLWLTVDVSLELEVPHKVLAFDINKTPATFIAFSDGTFIKRSTALLDVEEKIKEIDSAIKQAQGNARTEQRKEWSRLHNEQEMLLKPVARAIVARAKEENVLLGMDTVALKRNTTFGHDKLIKWVSRYAENSYVPHVAVNTPFTSQRCSTCGFVSANNRQTQANFVCQSCGHVGNADTNAAINIAQVAYADAHKLLPEYDKTVQLGGKPRHLDYTLNKLLLISDDADKQLEVVRGCDASSWMCEHFQNLVLSSNDDGLEA